METVPRTAASRQIQRVLVSAPSPTLLARVFHQPSLVWFSAVAGYLSIREAGRRLNVASSAVSRQVAGLEDALGLEPFQREGRRHKLSTAGECLHRHAGLAALRLPSLRARSAK